MGGVKLTGKLTLPMLLLMMRVLMFMCCSNSWRLEQ